MLLDATAISDGDSIVYASTSLNLRLFVTVMEVTTTELTATLRMAATLVVNTVLKAVFWAADVTFTPVMT